MRGRSKLWSFAFSGVSVLAFFVACDGGSARPLDTASSGDGGNTFEATVRDALEDTGDSGTCLTKAKDGTETDIDCGGSNNCARCELGKGCAAETDCAGGAKCMNKFCALCEDSEGTRSERSFTR